MYKKIIIISVLFSFFYFIPVSAQTLYVLIKGGNGIFWPPELVINEGDSVMFRNQDTITRNIVSESANLSNDLLNLGEIRSRDDVTVVFETSGVYKYRDKRVALRKGTIIVKDVINPSPITDLRVDNITDRSVDIYWTESGDNGMEKKADHYDMRYSVSQITADNFDSALSVVDLPIPTAPNDNKKSVLSNLNSNTIYYVALKIFDEANNSSGLSNILEFTTVSSISNVIVPKDKIINKTPEIVVNKKDKQKSLIDFFSGKNNFINLGDTEQVVNSLVNDGINVVRNVNQENKNKISFANVAKTQAQVGFVTYGFDKTTYNAGAGQRSALLHSFLRVHNRLPISKLDWVDIINIANGRFPTQRNLDAERASLLVFQRVYNRNPNFKKQADEKAIWIFAYGIQQPIRDISKEILGINKFKDVYKKNPTSTEDWDIVRAIGYSGVN